ncbi:MAG: cytochrome b/b6 domain-containing protein [Pseudomonadota bacterium]
MSSATADIRQVRYTAVAITLHWVMAALLIGMVVLGNFMFDDEGREIFWLYQLHKSIGITVLILTVARIIWRIMNPPPPDMAPMAGWESALSKVTHIGFYGLMLALPLSGWLLVSAAPVQVPTLLYDAVRWPHLPGVPDLETQTKAQIYSLASQAHELMGWMLAGLIALHVGGAAKHIVVDRVPLLSRMTPGGAPLRKASPASYVAAFGGALAVFGLVTAGQLVGGAAPVSDSARVTAADDGATGDANGMLWVVDQDASSIGFEGALNGEKFTGTFPQWAADIQFDPDALDAAKAQVRVDVRAINTPTKLHADTLAGPEWFDSAKQPRATVTVSQIEKDGDGYTGTAEITIKDKTVSVPFPFTLTISGETAEMAGTATLERKAFDLGQASDPGGQWITPTIDVSVRVTASRKGASGAS